MQISIFGQESDTLQQKTTIELEFVKINVTQSTNSLYFNILKITNNQSDAISGKLTISTPEKFQLISYTAQDYTIASKKTLNIPIRISLPNNVIGNQTYIISASFKTRDNNYLKSSYITIPAETKWDMNIETKKFYFNDFKTKTNLNIRLQNKGNTNELIKIELKIGKLLNISNLDKNQDYEYIELPAHKDTIINYQVNYNTNYDKYDEEKLKNIWKESTIKIKSSSKDKSTSDYVYFNKLESKYINRAETNASPLNIDLQFLNFLSTTPSRFNISTFGTILFPENRQLSYQVNGKNFEFSPLNEQNLSFQRNSYFYFNYRDRNKIIEIGENIGGNYLHSITGRGLKGQFSLNKNNKLSLLLTRGRYNPDYGAAINYTRNINNILQLRTGITYENNNSTNYNAYSAILGGTFSFLKYNNVSVNILSTQTNFNNLNKYTESHSNDTSTIGFAYSATYNLNLKKLNFKISHTNTVHNYIRNSNNLRFNIYGNYKINNKSLINLMFDRYKILQTSFPKRFYNPSNYNSNNIGKLMYGTTVNNNIYIQIGPSMHSLSQNIYNPTDGFTDKFKSNNYSLNASTRFRLTKMRSVTPYLSFSLLNAHLSSDNPLIIPTSYKVRKNFRLGLNFYDNSWRLTAFYIHGPTNLSLQQLKYDKDLINYSSIQIRPYIERYFYNKKLKVSAYANYLYRMPSGRETKNINTRVDLFLNKGWSLYLSNNIYTSARDDIDYGRITNRMFNMFFGCKKSFDIQQPRLKYYDINFLFFHDQNGDNIKDDNESPISSILLTLKRDRNTLQQKVNFTEEKLISDINGIITYENIPEGTYLLNFLALENLKNIHIQHGNTQELIISGDETFYIPYVENYKVKGKIILNRDKNSTEGKIDLNGIRVTASSEDGETYSVLTDKYGYFLLPISKAGIYIISVANVLGTNFNIEQDKYEINLNISKNVNVDFIFNEKKRSINIEGDNKYIFKSFGN